MELLIKFFLKICLFSTLLLAPINAQEIEIEKIPVNKRFSNEIAPLVHDSTLYFVSNRKNSVLQSIFNQDKEHLYKIYQAPLLPDGKIGKTREFKPEKSIKLTSGSIAISADNQRHIATLNKNQNVYKSKKQNNPLGLFESHRTNSGKWGEYVQLPFSENNDFSFAQPTLSSDGKTLIFVSDKEGGYGKTDLYYSILTDFGWSEPVNLGNKINSTESELFPFIHPSGKLYFSSNREGGYGGFDIYYSIFDSGNWSDPVLMQYPVNSEFDDFSCYIFHDESSGFFTSSREGKDNIYKFNYLMQFCEFSEEVQEENYCFTLFEERAIEADTIPVKYQWEIGDIKIIGVEIDYCFPGPGEYEIKLSVLDSLTNEFLYSVAEYTLELERLQQVYITVPEKTEVGSTVTLKAELTGFNDAVDIRYFWSIIENETLIGETIFYKFRKKGKYTIRCEAYWGDNMSICSTKTIVVD